MVERILFVFVMFISCLASRGGNVVVLSGMVKDRSGAGLPSATVKASFSDSTKVTITDVCGFYKMRLLKSDSIILCVSYEGFKTRHLTIRGKQDYIEKNIVLEEDAIALQEVVVQGDNAIHGNSKSMYFPTKTQLKGANTGMGLLYNMMIPELRVNKRNGAVSTSDNKNVTQCINGVPASATEIKGIRPKDVIRIDFYPIPTGKFARYEAVIDYVVRNYNHGGYIDVKTSTTVMNTSGDYDVVVKYNHNGWVNNIMSGFDFSDDRKNKTCTEEWVGMIPDFDKYSLIDKYKKITFSEFVHWGLTKASEKLRLSFKTCIMGNNIPHNDSENLLNYNPEVFPSSKSVIRKDSKSAGACVDGYMQWTINKQQHLMFDISCQYGHSGYNRYLSEDMYCLTTSTKENSYGFTAGMTYSINTAKGGNITFQVYDMGESYKDKYTGDMTANQKLVNNFIKASILYRHSFSKRLYAQADLSVQYVLSKVNETKEKVWLFLPALYLSYKTSERGRLVFNGKTGYVNPPIEWKSDICQNVNVYEQIKGNKDLHHTAAYMPSLSYSYSLKNLAMNFSVNSFLAKHSVQDNYLLENNKLVHTYSFGNSFYFFSFDYKLTTYLLNNNLQISGDMGYDITQTNDQQKRNWKCFWYSLDMMYNYRDFVFSGNYMSRRKGVEFTGSDYSIIPYSYNISASYSKGHWFASVGLNNIFGCKHYAEEYLKSSVYKRTTVVKCRDFYPSIVFKISYNIDFGNKKIEHEDDIFDRVVSTGYLHPKE